MKKCFKCSQTLPLSSFYAHPRMSDGTVNKCKECSKKDIRESRSRKAEYYRAYDRARSGKESRRESREKYINDHPEQCRTWKAEWAQRNREKRAAHSAVGNAIRSGRLQKMPCVLCGVVKSEAHHEDYSRPLDVVWLCSAHHGELHAMKREISRAGHSAGLDAPVLQPSALGLGNVQHPADLATRAERPALDLREMAQHALRNLAQLLSATESPQRF